MLNRLAMAISLALFVIALAAAPAWCQTKTARALDLDASSDSTPDPLTPAEKTDAAPFAPGAPASTTEKSPGAEADPVVILVRERLTAAPARSTKGDRDDHAGLAAFYAEATEPVWTAKDGFTARATQAIAEIRKADDWGLKASAFDLPSAPDSFATNEARADTEIRLGLAVLKYARHARGGRLEPLSVSRLFDQKPTIYDPQSMLRAVAVSNAVDGYLRGLHPKHPQFERLRQALLAARGAKPEEAPAAEPIPAGPVIKSGQENPHVALVRARLSVAAETDGKESVHDEALVAAVKAYQRQRGLPPTGTINAATRQAFNEPNRSTSSVNIQRLIANMERWRWMPVDLGPFYVWDSVPEQTTTVFDAGKPVLSEKIVVGKPSSPTPVFTADMLFVIFHPSWGVPPGMKIHELWPQLRNTGGGWFSSNPTASSVLNGHGLRVSRAGQPIDPDSVNWANVDIRSFDFTQGPGPRNVLGIVKFRFPNRHDVYMHDTPERHLFGGAVRAFSHGCMRVQNPVRLAEVILARDKGWAAEQVQDYVRRGGEIKLASPIPVHITYFTATVEDDGKVHYHPDIYGLDGRVASALEGQAVRLAAASTSPEPAAEAKERRSAKSRTQKKAPSPQPFNLLSIFGN
jgi:murein L,D-transpeptidase YcbB/YkuD